MAKIKLSPARPKAALKTNGSAKHDYHVKDITLAESTLSYKYERGAK